MRVTLILKKLTKKRTRKKERNWMNQVMMMMRIMKSQIKARRLLKILKISQYKTCSILMMEINNLKNKKVLKKRKKKRPHLHRRLKKDLVSKLLQKTPNTS